MERRLEVLLRKKRAKIALVPSGVDSPRKRQGGSVFRSKEAELGEKETPRGRDLV
jgi:hypothetical protein